MAQMHGARLQYLRNGVTMLEMAYEFDKRLIDVGNDVYMWEMAEVFEKLLKYVGNDVDLFKMANCLKILKMTQRFGKLPKYMESICVTAKMCRK